MNTPFSEKLNTTLRSVFDELKRRSVIVDYRLTNRQFDLTQLDGVEYPYIVCDLSVTSSEESEQLDNNTAMCYWDVNCHLVTLVNPKVSNPFSDIDTLAAIKIEFESRNIDGYPIRVTTVLGIETDQSGERLVSDIQVMLPHLYIN